MRALERAKNGRDDLFRWLNGEVFPLWGGIGTDHVGGGFFEKIASPGKPTNDARRARVVGRQVYSFCIAHTLGWAGPASDLVEHGLTALQRYDRVDGTVLSVIDYDGSTVREMFDLYDHAFVLLGLATVAGLFSNSAIYEARASQILNAMYRRWKHPLAGFEESSPRTLPLKANPHMHMLEACLAWVEASPSDSRWGKLADEIAELALDRFVCHQTGILREFYGADWQPLSEKDDRLVEPGHQCEWGWLLVRWGKLRGRPDAIEAARLLITTAERHGVDCSRGVMFNELDYDFSIIDYSARLWPQTERIKAWLALYSLAPDDVGRSEALEHVAEAIAGLLLFRREDFPGAYYDRLEADGTFREEAAPASSLYHLSCAARELQLVLPC